MKWMENKMVYDSRADNCQPWGYEDEYDHLATYDDSMNEFARNVGIDFPETEWLLTSYDVWVKNPFYKGKPGKHPEDDSNNYPLSENNLSEVFDGDFIPY